MAFAPVSRRANPEKDICLASLGTFSTLETPNSIVGQPSGDHCVALCGVRQTDWLVELVMLSV